jgi:hypothetical protein
MTQGELIEKMATALRMGPLNDFGYALRLSVASACYTALREAMEPVAWQRRRKWPLASDPPGKVCQWEECSRKEATDYFEREDAYEYRPLYTLPEAP